MADKNYYRDYDIVRIEVLEFCFQQRRISEITRKVRINHNAFVKFANYIIEKGFLEKIQTKKSSFSHKSIITYKTTEKGRRYVELLK